MLGSAKEEGSFEYGDAASGSEEEGGGRRQLARMQWEVCRI